MAEEQSPWLCHICNRTSTDGDAVVCGKCYKLSCRSHMTTAAALNQTSGLYELMLICAHCHLKKYLH